MKDHLFITPTRRLGEERLRGGGYLGAEGGDDVVDEAAAVRMVHPEPLAHRVVDEDAHEHLGPAGGSLVEFGGFLNMFGSYCVKLAEIWPKSKYN